MFKIPVGNNRFAIVDDCDMDLGVCFNWSLSHDKRGGGEAVQGFMNGKHVYLGRVIGDRMGLDSGKEVDHKDVDPLNNTRSNLRPATKNQNSMNRRVRSDNKLGVKGVCEYKGRFRAQLCGKVLGDFDTIEQAGEAYLTAATLKYGEFVRTGE